MNYPNPNRRKFITKMDFGPYALAIFKVFGFGLFLLAGAYVPGPVHGAFP